MAMLRDGFDVPGSHGESVLCPKGAPCLHSAASALITAMQVALVETKRVREEVAEFEAAVSAASAVSAVPVVSADEVAARSKSAAQHHEVQIASDHAAGSIQLNQDELCQLCWHFQMSGTSHLPGLHLGMLPAVRQLPIISYLPSLLRGNREFMCV